MTVENYKGWSNPETWAIQLRLTKNKGDYLAMCERAAELVEESGDSNDPDSGPAAVEAMADFIENWTATVFDSVINQDDSPTLAPIEARLFVAHVGSWWRADFDQIAEHWIDEARSVVK
jgi:hypothetical protein